MKPGDVRQIVLSNGTELLCEVIQWPDLDIDEQEVMIIRKACKIIIQENFEQGTRWFTFRPFMTYQDDASSLCSLMPYHIITIGNPSTILKNQYKKYQKLLIDEENQGKTEDPFQYFDLADSDMPPDNIIKFKFDKNKLN
jgi:hypothetical protein|tara:strand:- start:4591 stop:5010 length:420 start_codon:yes stop_codon:yes gene_type:complete